MADNMASRTPDIPTDGSVPSGNPGGILAGNYCSQPGSNDFWDGANCTPGEDDSTGRDTD